MTQEERKRYLERIRYGIERAMGDEYLSEDFNVNIFKELQKVLEEVEKKLAEV